MAINRVKHSKTFDCFVSLAMTQDYRFCIILRHCSAQRASAASSQHSSQSQLLCNITNKESPHSRAPHYTAFALFCQENPRPFVPHLFGTFVSLCVFVPLSMPHVSRFFILHSNFVSLKYAAPQFERHYCIIKKAATSQECRNQQKGTQCQHGIKDTSPMWITLMAMWSS